MIYDGDHDDDVDDDDGDDGDGDDNESTYKCLLWQPPVNTHLR